MLGIGLVGLYLGYQMLRRTPHVIGGKYSVRSAGLVVIDIDIDLEQGQVHQVEHPSNTAHGVLLDDLHLPQEVNEHGPDVIITAEDKPSQVAVDQRATDTRPQEVQDTSAHGEHQEVLQPLGRTLSKETRTDTDETLVDPHESGYQMKGKGLEEEGA
jgi:hypothetical protein